MVNQQSISASTFEWLVRGGAMGERLRDGDWSHSTLGAPETWSAAFRFGLNQCLSHSSPCLLLWGPSLIVLFNDAYLRLFGGERATSFGQPFEVSKWGSDFKTAFDLAMGGRGGESRGVHDGKSLHFQLVPVCEGTETLGVLTTIIDLRVSVDVLMPKADVDLLQKNEERFRLMFANAAVLVAMVDVKGRIMHVNQTFIDKIGYSSEELIGRSFSEISHADDFQITITQMEKLYYREQKTVSFEKRYICKDGRVMWIHTSVSPVFADDGSFSYVISVAQDISDRKLIEADVVQAREEAVRANESKSRFLANMSHEIRTPLGIIRGFADLLLEDRLDRQAPWLDSIRRNVDELGKLVNDILDLSKIEADHLHLEHIEINLADFLSEVRDSFQVAARGKGLELIVTLEEPLPKTIISDPTRLRQILLNVLGNALKFTENGSVMLKLRASAIAKKRAALEFEISDTGIGMTPEQTTGLFEAFAQADASTTRRFGGSGLGLALSRQLARALGGDLKLQASHFGQGTTFSLSLEIETREHHVYKRTPSFVDHKSDQRQLADLKILVVEDSADNRVLLQKYLEHAGAKVEFAVDGADGIERAVEKRYDLIVMDIQMPRMDGYAACSALRAAGHREPIVALTAHAMRGERERCLSLGFSEYLTKPIDRHLLTTTLLRLYRSRQKKITTGLRRSLASPSGTGPA